MSARAYARPLSVGLKTIPFRFASDYVLYTAMTKVLTGMNPPPVNFLSSEC